MNAKTFTIEDQIQAAQNALHFLELGNPHLAHEELVDAIQQTPTDSPLYGALIGSCNWIDLGQITHARLGLIEAITTIEHRVFSF